MRRRRSHQRHLFLPSSSAFCWWDRGCCCLCDNLSSTHLASGQGDGYCESAGQTHHVSGIVGLAPPRRWFNSQSLLRCDWGGGGCLSGHGHGCCYNGLICSWDELNLASLWHCLDGLGSLDLWHHLILYVGCGGICPSWALDSEHNRVARAGRAQASRQLNHIAFG